MITRTPRRLAGALFRTTAVIGTALIFSFPATANERGAERSSVLSEVLHLLHARHDRDNERQTSQPTPALIPRDKLDVVPGGLIETLNAGGPTLTRNNAFFQDLGTNGRTCFTCHQGDQGWGVSAQAVRLRFLLSSGTDPIFRPVDGAVCPTANTSTVAARAKAYSLLLDRGLIRIGLPLPANAEFQIVDVSDPYGCNTNPATGLTSPTTGMVSVYRRPLPSTNLRLLSSVMWDGREGGLQPPNSAPPGQPSLIDDLSQQAIDATTGHAQATNPPTPEQVAQIVDFEMGLTTAQAYDIRAQQLNAKGASGGAAALLEQPFYLGINDPFGLNPSGTQFTSAIFTLYDPWANLRGSSVNMARAAVARGQKVFNTTQINITGVAGINDAVNQTTFVGSCATCHDTPNGGNHSVGAPLNINIAGAGPDAPPALNIKGLPVFTVKCSVSTYFHQANTTFQVTDIGRAMLSGKCADIGKTKGPILRGLASRAPYFHNGGAATLMDAVNFYDKRFNIGFTSQEKADLVAFLMTL
jgi:hypothetical protein